MLPQGSHARLVRSELPVLLWESRGASIGSQTRSSQGLERAGQLEDRPRRACCRETTPKMLLFARGPAFAGPPGRSDAGRADRPA